MHKFYLVFSAIIFSAFFALIFCVTTVKAEESIEAYAQPLVVDQEATIVHIQPVTEGKTIDQKEEKDTIVQTNLSQQNAIVNEEKDEGADFLASDSTDPCSKTHNSNKQYSVTSAARLLSGMLGKGPNGMLTNFKCGNAHSAHVPEKVKEVYKLSSVWNPVKNIFTGKYTNDHIQCTTFVFMSYQLANNPITKKGRSNADDFLADKYSGEQGQFVKHQSGNSDDLPQVGDLAVWSAGRTKTPYGHVGVIVEVRQDSTEFGTIRVANANSTKSIHEYRFVKDSQTNKIKITGVKNDWVLAPDYWLRKK